MALYTGIVQTLAALAVFAIVTGVGLLVAHGFPGGRGWLRDRLGGQELHPIGWAWLVAMMATSGSLYFSDVVGFVPCLLCWYQRIAMYPIVLVLGVGLAKRDPTAWRFALPLPLVGLVISLYHVFVQYQPELEIIECGAGVSCTSRYMLVFGFVSIPVMAVAAFLLIAALLITVRTVQLGGVGGAAQHNPALGVIGVAGDEQGREGDVDVAREHDQYLAGLEDRRPSDEGSGDA